MKIATLAYQRHENVGAVLQCYALQNTIISEGHECAAIDYICGAADRVFGLESLRVKGLKKYVTSCIGVISRLPKRRAFIRFRKNMLLTTSACNKKNISALDGKFDGYIVGSDNVWNSRITGLDKNYFLDFVTDNGRKASYAASMGLAKIPENERGEFKRALSGFAAVTAREKRAAEDIGSLIGKEVRDTCDPTLLLTRRDWDKLLVEPKEKNYVLVYHMSPSARFARFAAEFAKSKGLKIVYVPFPYGFCRCLMKPHIGPHEWLGYIKNAEYVVTDSFHGCVFSMIYEKNLIIKISKLGERINNFTEKLGIQNRAVNSAGEAAALPPLDYENSGIREKISEYRAEGLNNLRGILKLFEENISKG